MTELEEFSQAGSYVLDTLVNPIKRLGADLALFLVYDRPERTSERPGLERAFFRQRCVSDIQLSVMIDTFRSIRAYVELFQGERPFIDALSSGRLAALGHRIKIAYNGIEGSIAHDGFQPGRKALLPAVADSYGILCANSNPYACALGRHKFHYLTVLSSLGFPVPKVWHYRPEKGWAGDRTPPRGLKVIAKSTYESWSVGVTDESVFSVDSELTKRVSVIADKIGQAVTVQEFIPGREVCVPVLSTPYPLAAHPVEAVLSKAPGDPNAIMTIDDNLAHEGVTYHPCHEAPLVRRLSKLSTEVFSALECDGFARIDFRVNAEGEPFIFDVGISPGLSMGSSSFSSLSLWGLTYKQFLLAVIAASLISYKLLD